MTDRASRGLRSEPPPRLLGVGVAALAVAAITLVIYPLREISPPASMGVAYLLAMLLVSTIWSLWLGVLTSVASAAACNFFHLPPTGRFTLADSEHWVALAIFLVAAVVASAVAELARSRASEAEQRRREADLAAELARMLLGGASVQAALDDASDLLAFWRLGLSPVDSSRRPWNPDGSGCSPFSEPCIRFRRKVRERGVARLA